ncbi:flagellar basal-body MS-ring/collar protein FliF [Niveibacterium terrae]|uniref:flagellar basal-body MS-ring/collar protein FliF n=1 Tax=Niveibacterium terrae TaxID=3373598 RepID=UPI003A957F37
MAEADLASPAPPPQSPLEQVRANFDRLTPRQKMAGAVAIAICVALLVGMWLWSRKPDYAVLFSGLEEKDGGAIVTALQAQNIPYKVSDQNGAILVPAAQVGDLRLRLASQGLPKGGNVGFELMENERIGLSQFAEQINYQRALEGELGRTISSLSEVQAARVHLAIPKQTSFLRDEQKPTASVVLTLRNGRALDPSQVAGIAHLISSSVPQLTTESVSVLDQNGKLLSSGSDPLREAGLDPTQLKYVHEVEDRYIKRIEEILEPVVGPNNLRARVNADVDFDQQEQTAETYRPNPSPQQAIRSQQLADSTTLQPNPAGVPGALSNQPPVPATAPLTTPAAPGTPGASGPVGTPLSTNRNSTTNYELDKTIQHVKKSLGQVKRLSVAVVVNYKVTRDAKGNEQSTALTPVQMKQINDLVREAVGYSAQRGDTLNIANSPFNLPAKTDDALPFWKDPEMQSLGKDLGRWLLIAAILLFLWLAVLRPLVRTVAPPPPPPPPKSEEAEPGEEGEEGPQLNAEGEIIEEELLPPEVRAEEIALMSFEKKLAKAREIAVKNPKVIANLLKEWMGTNTNERR